MIFFKEKRYFNSASFYKSSVDELFKLQIDLFT